MGVDIGLLMRSLLVVYRITINFTDLPYGPHLNEPNSAEFQSTSHSIAAAIEQLFAAVQTNHDITIIEYRYHQVIGTLVTFDIHTDSTSAVVRKLIEAAVDSGHIGPFTVAHEGYEFHSLRDEVSLCLESEFKCLDGSCIPMDLRCDGTAHCKDRTDEDSDYAFCPLSKAEIRMDSTRYEVGIGQTTDISAIIKRPGNQQVIWILPDGREMKENQNLGADARIVAFSEGDRYFLRIQNTHPEDAGQYSIAVGDSAASTRLAVVRDSLLSPKMAAAKKCPLNEKPCLSGHCLALDLWCDGKTDCPDGDDEIHCRNIFWLFLLV